MNRRWTLALTLAGAAVLSGPLLAQGGSGWARGGTRDGQCIACANDPAAVQPLNETETAMLRKMREEEKLARDVYEFLYEKWQLRVFRNIAASEQRHFDSIGNLLTRYSVADPARTERGMFTDAALQTLYIELTASGDDSVAAALEAGVAIEKLDIEDLEAAIVKTGKTDLKRVYANLLRGSLNHLDAFERNLAVAPQIP